MPRRNLYTLIKSASPIAKLLPPPRCSLPTRNPPCTCALPAYRGLKRPRHGSGPRLITKDPVTSPLRAPFTVFEGQEGQAELKEEVRGHGARKAVGELVTCPFCSIPPTKPVAEDPPAR